MTGAAFFDVDGTLVAGNIVRYYADLKTLDLSPVARASWIGAFALRVPWYLALDAFSRSRFQRAFYRNYRGLAVADLERRSRQHYERFLSGRLYPAAEQRVREHARRGDAIVLVTGSLRPIVAPLAEHLEATDLVAAEMEAAGGVYTGRLKDEPLAHRHKADAVAVWARRRGVDPAHCWAYADSLDDIPMLESVGHAAVVNPGSKLAREARSRGWDVLHWSRP